MRPPNMPDDAVRDIALDAAEAALKNNFADSSNVLQLADAHMTQSLLTWKAEEIIIEPSTPLGPCRRTIPRSEPRDVLSA